MAAGRRLGWVVSGVTGRGGRSVGPGLGVVTPPHPGPRPAPPRALPPAPTPAPTYAGGGEGGGVFPPECNRSESGEQRALTWGRGLREDDN